MYYFNCFKFSISSNNTCLTVNADNVTIYGGKYVYSSDWWCYWDWCRTKTLVKQNIDAPIAIDANARVYGENGKNVVVQDLISLGGIYANGASGRTGGSSPDAGGQGGNIKLINSNFNLIISNGGDNVLGGGNGGNIKLINSNIVNISSNGGMHFMSSTGFNFKSGRGGNIDLINSNFNGMFVSANAGYSSFNGPENGGIISIINSSIELSVSPVQFSLKKSGAGNDGYVIGENIKFYNSKGSVLFERIPGLICNNYNLGDLIGIDYSSAEVRTDLCPGLNQPATITSPSLSFPQGAKITIDGNPAPEGSYNILSYSNPFKLWVSHF